MRSSVYKAAKFRSKAGDKKLGTGVRTQRRSLWFPFRESPQGHTHSSSVHQQDLRVSCCSPPKPAKFLKYTYIHVLMATKTLTITEDAYERLAARKENNESFSEVIVRYFPKHSLMEIAGILTHEEAGSLRRSIAESRKRSRERLKRIAGRFQ